MKKNLFKTALRYAIFALCIWVFVKNVLLAETGIFSKQNLESHYDMLFIIFSFFAGLFIGRMFGSEKSAHKKFWFWAWLALIPAISSLALFDLSPQFFTQLLLSLATSIIGGILSAQSARVTYGSREGVKEWYRYPTHS